MWRNWHLYVTNGGSSKWLSCCGSQFWDPQRVNTELVCELTSHSQCSPRGTEGRAHASPGTHMLTAALFTKGASVQMSANSERINMMHAYNGIVFSHTDCKIGWGKYHIYRSNKNDTICGTKYNRNIQPGQKESWIVQRNTMRLNEKAQGC